MNFISVLKILLITFVIKKFIRLVGRIDLFWFLVIRRISMKSEDGETKKYEKRSGKGMKGKATEST